MPKGRAASNMALGQSSLPMLTRPTLPVQANPQALASINKIPLAPPATVAPTVPPVAMNNVPANFSRVASPFSTAPSTLAPPIIGGPPLSVPANSMANPLLGRKI